MRGSRRDNQPAIFRNVRDRFGRGADKKIDTEHAFGRKWRHDESGRVYVKTLNRYKVEVLHRPDSVHTSRHYL